MGTMLDIRGIIEQSYFTKGFSPEFVDAVAGISAVKDYPEGSHVIDADDETADMYILAEGKLNVLTPTGDLIIVLRPPMPFGEVSFLDGKRRSSTVIADEDSKVIFIPENAFWELLKQYPDMAVQALTNLGVLLCSRLRNANQQIAALNAIEEFSV